MKNLPSTLKTLNDEDIKRVFWVDIKDGMIVYLYATHQTKQYGCGPFQVINAKTRCIKRTDSFAPFFHYTEELYRLV